MEYVRGRFGVTLLDGAGLRRALAERRIEDRLVVTPLLDPDEQIGRGSIDLRLDASFVAFRRSYHGGVDPLDRHGAASPGTGSRMTVSFGDGFWLHPGEMVLGGSLEFIRLPPTLSAYVLGRSTWGRLGLLVATAIMVHPGFSGSLTLELVNTSSSPLKLYPGLRVAQLAIHRVEQGEPADDVVPRTSQYSGSTRAQAPRRAWTDAEMKRIQQLGTIPRRNEGSPG